LFAPTTSESLEENKLHTSFETLEKIIKFFLKKIEKSRGKGGRERDYQKFEHRKYFCKKMQKRRIGKRNNQA